MVSNKEKQTLNKPARARIRTYLKALIVVDLIDLTTISPQNRGERDVMCKYLASIAGLCSCLLSFEKSEEINYVRCLVLQQLELLKYCNKMDYERSNLYESVVGEK